MQILCDRYLGQNRTNPKQYWTDKFQRPNVGSNPTKHSWVESDQDIGRVLDNIAAAAHAGSINKKLWVRQCFATPEDCIRFLDFFFDYRRHINSYWYYALLDIAEVDEEQACDTKLLAERLFEQAVRTQQLQDYVD